MSQRRYARPRWGTGLYELFDCAVFLFAAATLVYILTGTTSTQRQALYGPLTFAPDYAWGGLLAGAGLVAFVCSLRVDGAWFRFGRSVLRSATLFWSLVFLVGVVLYIVRLYFMPTDLRPPDADLRDIVARGLFSFVLYGWIWSRMTRVKVPA